MDINKLIREIDETVTQMNSLKARKDKLVEYIKDEFPLRRGDRFSYSGEYCGTMMWLGISEPGECKAFIWVEYETDDGEYDAIYNVDANLIKKVTDGRGSENVDGLA